MEGPGLQGRRDIFLFPFFQISDRQTGYTAFGSGKGCSTTDTRRLFQEVRGSANMEGENRSNVCVWMVNRDTGLEWLSICNKKGMESLPARQDMWSFAGSCWGVAVDGEM
jgi:hypothetical protein